MKLTTLFLIACFLPLPLTHGEPQSFKLNLWRPLKLPTLAVAIRPTESLEGLHLDDLKALGLVKVSKVRQSLRERWSRNRRGQKWAPGYYRQWLRRLLTAKTETFVASAVGLVPVTKARGFKELLARRANGPLETETFVTARLALEPATTVCHVGGCNLQTTINAAALGDTIVLDKQSLGTYSGPFTLAAKVGCDGSQYVTIESEEISLLPTGTRVTAADNIHMAKVQTTDNSGGLGAFVSTTGTGCYRLRGLEVTNDTTVAIGSMIDFRGAIYMIYDRNFQHPKELVNVTPPYNTTARFAMALTGGNHIQVTNNRFDSYYGIPPGSGAGSTGTDTIMFALEAGPTNDVTIDNNYVNMWYTALFLGGGDSPATESGTIQASSPTPSVTTARFDTVAGLAIGDVIAIQIPWVMTHCKQDVSKPCYGNGVVSNIVGTTVTYSALVGTDQASSGRVAIPGGVVPSGVGIWGNGAITNVQFSRNRVVIFEPFAAWVIANNGNHPKGWMELKNASGPVLITGNVFEGFPAVAGIATANQAGGDPATNVSNVTFSNNWFKSFYSPFFATMVDPYYVSTSGSTIVYTNNLFTGMLTNQIPGLDNLVLSGQNGTGFVMTHNTILTGYPNVGTLRFGIWQQSFSNFMGPTTFNINNNLVGWGNHGMDCDGGGMACVTLTETKNLMVLNVNPPGQDVSSRFPNSLTAATWAAALLVDGNTCNAGTDIQACAVQGTSPAFGTGTAGSNIGADINAIAAALSPSDGGSTGGARVSGSVILKGKVTIK